MINKTNPPQPFGYIYRITNKESGKTYIGMRFLHRDTKGWRQYLGSSKIIKGIINSGDSHKLIKEFLQYAYSKNELIELERKYIKREWSNDKGEYNQVLFTPDADNSSSRSEHDNNLSKIKRSKSLKKTINSPDYISGRGKKALDDYNNFLKNNNTKLLIKEYKDIGSMFKIAQKYNISQKYLRRLLTSNNIELNHQNKKGRIINNDKKQAISNGVNNYLNTAESFKYTYNCKKCKLNKKSQVHNQAICEDCK